LKNITKISDIPIKNIVETSNRHFWILAANKGFYNFKKRKLIKMPLDKDELKKNPHSIVEDPKGDFWISSNKGLFRTDGKKLCIYDKNNRINIFYYRYGKNDGLVTEEFNGQGNPSSNKLANGEIVLPSLEGLVFFRPESNRYYHINHFFTERAKVDQVSIAFKDTLLLKNNNFSKIELFLDFPYYN